jgi:glucose/arabinose dehydrogenase
MPVALRRTELALLVAVAALAVAVAFARGGSAAPGDPQLALVGRFTTPTYLTSPPGDRDRLFVVEQAGRIRIVRGGATLPTPFLDIASLVVSGGERGLLSLAFPPDYSASGRFYVYYTARNPSGAVTIAEYRVSTNADVADPASQRIVLSIAHPRSNHNGGQLQFGPEGYLYIGTGDGGGGGDPDRAGQRLDTLLGKLLRIDPRPGPGGAPYNVPAGNPFVGRAGARPEIWSYGLRNPWRFSFDRQTGDLSIADVGQNQWEEIDLSPAASGAGRGANFGWSCWEGRHVYENNSGNPECNPLPTNHVPPVWEYSHNRGCSITGGYVVRDQTLPALAGRYVYGDYCDAHLWSAQLRTPDAQEDRRLGLDVSSLTSFGEDACGRVYAVSQSGPVYRLQAAGAAAGPCPVPKPVSRCRVPRVVGFRLVKARTRIRLANCRVGRVRYKRSTRARGRVVTQSPRPGAQRARGARVNLTLSRGRRR